MSTAEQALMYAAPEVGVPLLAAKTAVAHPRAVFGGTLVALSVLVVIVAIIVLAAGKSGGSKTGGWLTLALGVGLGAYGGHLIAQDRRA